MGKHVVEPDSASAQLSADGKTLVSRIVNNGPATNAVISLAGFVAGEASAVALASDDLDAENTAAVPDRVAPAKTDASVAAGGASVSVALPATSYVVVTIQAAA